MGQLVRHPHAVQETACNVGDPGSIPGSGRSPGEGNGHPLHYSCLENSMDKGARRATVRGVARFGHDLATRPPLSVQWDQLATFFEEQKMMMLL